MLSWVAIFRLGLVQMCIGSIIVLMTSTLNRIMVVELALPAIVPGLLVGLHYAMQLTRPGWGIAVGPARAADAVDHRRDDGSGCRRVAGGGVCRALSGRAVWLPSRCQCWPMR